MAVTPLPIVIRTTAVTLQVMVVLQITAVELITGAIPATGTGILIADPTGISMELSPQLTSVRQALA